MATAKQLQGQLEKLNARIKKQQEDLSAARTKQKEVKAQLAEARAAEKSKAKPAAKK